MLSVFYYWGYTKLGAYIEIIMTKWRVTAKLESSGQM